MQHRFERPQSIAEAARLLASGPWSVLAGGTDLYPAHVGRAVAAPLLDITAIAALRGIRHDERGWTIGATTTWTDIVARRPAAALFGLAGRGARGRRRADPELRHRRRQPVQRLARRRRHAGAARARRRGRPASERGERELPIPEFVLGSRRTARAADELVVAVRVPARSARARSAFAKLGGRRYLTISISTVAVVVDVDETGAITDAGVAVGSCSAAARRLPALEARLRGAAAGDDLGALLVPGDLAVLTPIDDLRGSAAYRHDATATLVRRALREATRP